MSCYKKTVFLFFCFVLLLLIHGCEQTQPSRSIKDLLPQGVPRGYVEFYYLKDEGNTGYTPRIYKLEGDKESFFEGMPTGWENKRALRIAKIPGNYSFSIKLGTANETIDIQIESGMVTPVKIRFGQVVHRPDNKIYFNMIVFIEDRITVEQYNQLKENFEHQILPPSF